MNPFNINNFMPHGHCYLWRTDILLLNVIPDIAISFCYFSIPLLLIYILKKRPDLPFRATIRAFILFVFFCSLTHIMEIINVWYPLYFLTGIIKALTAIISLYSTYIILKSLKKILALPSLTNIEHTIFNDLQEVIKKLPVGIIFSDSKGQINYHNEYINKIFEYTPDELNQKEVELLIEPDKKKEHKKYKSEYLKNPTEKIMGGGRVLKGITKSGKEKLLEIGLRPIQLKGKSTSLTLVAIKDVTLEERQKREVEEALKLVNVATYGMPSLLSFIDKDGKYQFVNKAYLDKWCIEEEKVISAHYKTFLPIETASMIEEKITKSLSGEEQNFKISVDFPLEGIRELDVFYIPYRSKESQNIEGVVILGHDITDLNQTLKKLEASNDQLEEYAFLVSHDLRAPSRHISNFVEVLIKEINSDKPDKEKLDKYSNILISNSLKMQNMISGMLKIASINQVTPTVSSIKLSEFFEEIKESYSERAEFLIKEKSNLTVKLDKDLLNSVFINLIENSINFSPEKPAMIEIEITKRSKYVEFAYKDQGTGISESLAVSMFNPFIKADNSTGLGLGMTIVQRSLEKINGNISCTPSDEGAIFEIKIALY